MPNRVLIVSADAETSRSLRELLADQKADPFSVETSGNLSAAITSLGSGDPDVVVADLHMPGCQGIEAFDRLFSAAPHTPIVVICRDEEVGLADLAVQNGAQGFFFKRDFQSSLTAQMLRNVIKRKAVEAAMFLEKARAEIMLNSISDAVIGTDMAGNVEYLNVAAESITGWSRAEAHGQQIDQVMRILDGGTRRPIRNPVALVLQEDKPMGMVAGTVLVRRDGQEVTIEDSASPIHDYDDKICGAVLVFHDVTVARAMSLKMAHLAQHDYLTDLPNRSLLNDRLLQAIALAERHAGQVAILFLDLDRFKEVNDSIGHAGGDLVLQAVAKRLEGCIGRTDTVSRHGGDEFVVLLSEIEGPAQAGILAERMLQELKQPIFVKDRKLQITGSIGISVYPEDGEKPNILLHCADAAMYKAKINHRNTYQFYSREIMAKDIERKRISDALELALDRDEFVVLYQPNVNLFDCTVVGVEALLRWNSPGLGMQSPGLFIPVAEETGLILPIGHWVLREACAQGKRWEAEGLKVGTVAVNISALEFRQKNFVADIRSVLEESAFDPAALQLEITESVLMNDVEESAKILYEIKEMGIRIAVDDFGIGYSSLSYLNRFPVDIIKIDQSFVRCLTPTSGDGIIVTAIIAMANSLKIAVIAEGIETKFQLDFLRRRGCREGQGFLFSTPQPPEDISRLVISSFPQPQS
ncbi:EAL domain-containing protein [Pseudoxanthobacter sp. M-2]|uniref:putative bifunctional diguanylate cyclase/phosphodiesterase n=1 Tax=Pseudoxanthobacter sp. M-2 TaxID=3078754 RepID=UPI0038FCA6B2